MKELIIGIDGGDYNILSKMPAPFIQNFFANACQLQLSEDLLSRGWAEIVSGAYAKETKACYMMPHLNGRHDFSGKYSLDDMLKNQEVSPIWEIPGKVGKKVGIMNVPTTFPAQAVDGFFISGAGGGVNKVDGIPPELCHPKSLVQELEKDGYVIDLRFGTAGIKDIQVLFDQINDMMEKRVEAFIKLCHQDQPDFGFLALRATTVVQYLAMYEIERYFTHQQGNLAPKEVERSQIWFKNFENHYKLLDDLIQLVFEKLDPQHWILTADHGATPYRYKLNANAFLLEHGFQKKKVDYKRTFKNIIRKHILMKKLEGNLISYTTDWSSTKAFGKWYLSGIFLNDKKRFNGPVQDNEIKYLIEKICSSFNQTEEALEHNMKAIPYRSVYAKSKYSDYLPDIKIDCPETIFSDPNRDDIFIRPNELYGPLDDLNKVSGGMVTGQKSRYPLFCCDTNTGSLIHENDPRDLTLVYKLTERIFAQ